VNLVCFGQQNWHYCWTGKQQLLTRLAERGHRILYVDPTWLGTREPGFVPPRATGSEPGLHQVGPGDLHVLTYGFARLLRHRGNVWRWPRVIRRTLEELDLPRPTCLALRPGARPLVEHLDPRGVVYYAVDEMTAFGDRSEGERREIRRKEEAMLRRADVAVGVSPRLHARFRTVHPRSRLLPNGADLEHFSPGSLAAAELHPALRDLPDGPTLVFVGQVDDRLDQELVVACARAIPELRVVLAGRVRRDVDVSALEREARVHLLGYVPYEELPSVLRAGDVCAVPYRVNELTRSCNPLKVFEYLATGLPVVSTPLDALAWCADVVRLASDREEFVDGVRDALRHGTEGREARLDRARSSGWDARVDDLEEILEEAAQVDDHRRAARAAPPDPRFAGDRMGRAGSAMLLATGALGRSLSLARRGAALLPGRPRSRRILVARRTRLGDLVVFLPTLEALRGRYPEARIELAVQPGADGMARTLLRDRGLVDEVLAPDFLSRPRARDRIRGAFAFAGRGYDLLLSGAGYSVMRAAFFCGAPLSVGLDDGQPLQRHLDRRIPLDPFRHEAENHLAVAEAAGGAPLGPSRAPRVPTPPPEATGAVLGELGLDAEVSYAVVHPGAQKPSRQWPAERFTRLLEGLLEARPELRVVVTGTAGEAARVRGVVQGLDPLHRGRCRPAAGATDLEGLIALLAGASLVVCGDTGVLHLARALGRPLLALLGPENDARWGPHPGGGAPTIALREPVPCAPCKRWDCAPLYCLRSVRVEAAEEAALELLDAGGPAPTHVEGWARGHGARLGQGPPLPVHGVERRGTRRSWTALAEAGHGIPVVEVRSGERREDVQALARRLAWPAAFLRMPGQGESAGGARPELLVLAPDLDRWPPGRLEAEAGALMRWPALGVAGRDGARRNPAGPLSPDGATWGVTVRASALAHLSGPGGAAAPPGPEQPAGPADGSSPDGTRPADPELPPGELRRVREALALLPERLRPGDGPAS
jgi:ADP-heptose:LPS heptosyltransferase/glycosyltransferase involved in cell wall biosynthesis